MIVFCFWEVIDPFVFLPYASLAASRTLFVMITGLSVLYFRFRIIVLLVQTKKGDFCELWQQHRQLKTMEMSEEWYFSGCLEKDQQNQISWNLVLWRRLKEMLIEGDANKQIYSRLPSHDISRCQIKARLKSFDLSDITKFMINSILSCI